LKYLNDKSINTTTANITKMYIATDINTFHIKNVVLHEPVKNILKAGSEFTKIIYSDKNMMLNGIYILMDMRNIEIYKVKSDKLKIRMNSDENMRLLTKLVEIEKELLGLIQDKINKIYHLKLDILKLRALKLSANKGINLGYYDSKMFIIRIFGVWSDDNNCGLNYQIILNDSNNICMEHG
tara:strand:+ start:694 stop:1239 length:546 start_codon:yes stop_codon:yes gene_type:complete